MTTLSFEFWFHFPLVTFLVLVPQFLLHAYHCVVFDIKSVTATGDLQRQHESENWHNVGSMVDVASLSFVVSAS